MTGLVRAFQCVLLFVVLWLVGVPLAFVFYGAVHEPGAPAFVLTGRYLEHVFLTTRYLIPLWNTLQLALSVCVVATLIGLLLAWMMARTKVYGRLFLEVAIIVPIFMSPFIGAIGWVTLATPSAGLLNNILTAAHVAELDIFGFWGCVFTMALYLAPYGYSLLRDPLAKLNPEFEEAAETCGAPRARRMGAVIIPMISPPLLSSLMMLFIIAAEMFSIPGILVVPSGFPVLSYSIVQLTTRWPVDYSEAAAVGLLLLIITLIGIVLYRRMLGTQERFVAIGPRAARIATRESGTAWRLFATGVCFIYVTLAVLMPLLALGIRALVPYFPGDFSVADLSFDRFRDLAADGLVRASFLNSVLVTGISIVVLLVLAFLIAVGKVRGANAISRLTELVASLPIAVPGLLFGVGLLWMYIGSPVYATVWIILLVMLARFLPLLVRIFETGLIQIGRELDEAAAVSGASELTTMLAVRLPLLRGAARAAASVATTQTFNEITASTLLFTSGSAIIPVLIYNYAMDGDFSRASAIALVQISILTAGLVVLTGFSLRSATVVSPAQDQSLRPAPVGSA